MQFQIESAEKVGELRYTAAASGGGSEVRSLPLLRVRSAQLVPSNLEGLLLASDLQGVAPVPSRGGELGLLGEAVVDWYESLAQTEDLPPAAAVGVVLAGDLFSEPHARKRGATGDVGPVWAALASRFAWVAGVGGNHDLFTSRVSRQVRRRSNVALLDGDVADFDGLRVGGVSGIVGQKGKPNRRTLPSFVNALQVVLADKPDIVVLHEGPPGPDRAQRGRTELLAPIERAQVPLVVSGHVHWPTPSARIGNTTVLNVDGRAVLAVPE